MEKYTFLPNLLLRSPLYSYQDSEINYSDMLTSESFKTAVFLASRSFFNEVKKKEFNYDLLTDKQKQTIKKYLNRARFRSTPFGLFSSVCLVEWQQCLQSEKIILSDPSLNIKLDFVILQQLWQRFLKNRKESFVEFITNQSFQYNSIDFRYIKKQDQDSKVAFVMVSIEKNGILKKLLRYCRQGKSYTDILNFLLNKFGISIDDAEVFIEQLIDEQIIIPGTFANITGADYGDLLFEYLDQCCAVTVKEQLKVATKTLSWNEIKAGTLEAFSLVVDRLTTKHDNQNCFYAISKREAKDGSVPLQYQQILLEGLGCLRKLQAKVESPDLQKFKEDFIAKYESQEVPLLEVLDSQFGIGYSHFDQIQVDYGFSRSYKNQTNSQQSVYHENKLATVLVNEWQIMNSNSCSFELEIKEEHLRNLSMENAEAETPPGLSVMFRVFDGKLVIESAGGASALPLIGRFAFFKDVFRSARLIAMKEQQFNPDIVFAEIAHACNTHTANINRRPQFYDYEIPVLTNSVMPVEKQIPLNDILVSVVNNTVVIRSKKLRKRIIPRLSSALNYTKSSFPVFRFLCDIQNQDLATHFGFSLSGLLPGLKFYPRIVYKSCVLQLAEWHLYPNDLALLKGKVGTEAFMLFRKLCQKLRLPRHFTYSVADNFLVFDSGSIEDVTFFLKEISNREEVILKEFPFLQSGSNVENQNGQGLLPQYTALLFKSGKTYSTIEDLNFQSKQLMGKKNTEDWIYFKLYCHPHSSGSVLIGHLFPLVKRLIKTKQVNQWFWIRYNDPQYHIRIRVKVKIADKINVLNQLSACFESLFSKGVVHHYQTDIYKRELKRYSNELIEKVEAVFEASSYLVVDLFQSTQHVNSEGEHILTEAVVSTSVILGFFGITGTLKVSFCKLHFDEFFAEIKSPHNLKNDLEKLFKKLAAQILEKMQAESFSQKYKRSKMAINCLMEQHRIQKIQTPSLEKLARDIIHMHLNRLFIYDQRYFEMITYFLVYRSENVQLHKNTNG